MPRVKDRNGIYAGLFLIGVAAVFLWQGRNLRLGTLDEMGPGYFPVLLCVIQIVLGSAVIATAFLEDGAGREAFSPRPLLLVLASVCFFGAAIETLGLPLSLIGVVMLAGFAGPGVRHLQNLGLGILLAVACALIFVKGLALQMSIWPVGIAIP